MNQPDPDKLAKLDPALTHYYPDAPVVNEAGWGPAPGILRALLSGEPRDADIDWRGLLGSARNEGIINFVTFRALQAGLTVPGEISLQMRHSLMTGEADKLSGDFELARIFAAADEAGLRLLLIKGEALARTIYPSGACRPSGDFDLLMDTVQLELGEQVMAELGYTPGAFEGVHMFGQRTWQGRDQGRPFVVDLHWDLTNRRFFRNRLSVDTLLDRAQQLPLPDGCAWIPTTRDALLIACVHLAAAKPHMPVDLRWLLDIFLLLDELEQAQFNALVAEARDTGLVDVLANYCGLADRVLGPCRHRGGILELVSRIDPARKRQYQRCCEQRWYDLLEYGRRLPGWKQRSELLRQTLPYVFSRLGRSSDGPV
ncbi:MAG: nucleotidyltransferase family protein [Xanthomonadales bacterium]|nr:nucleotidyltransferase family protein [Xanthomonadales bacterium]